jgi:amidase
VGEELAFRSATELVAAIRAREVSPRELVELYLGRIERLNPRINAVVTLDAERALAAADVPRGGPLHGLPITLKDQFETAGLRTTCGAEEWREHVPPEDAVPVARLREAGAILLGKTNLPAYAADWQTFNDLFGTTSNPWDRTRTPGGSSGGAAAAVAAGLTALELGGDIGGSIRNPASWCGVFGHKTSYGLVPSRGTLPAPPGTLAPADLAVRGPIARSADDLELALGVLSGPDVQDAVAWRLELPPPRRSRTQDYRVALWLDDGRFPIAAEVREPLERAAQALEDAGARVDGEARPKVDLAEAVRLRRELVYPILALGLSAENFDEATERARLVSPDDEDREALWLRFATQPHREWLRARERRERMRAAWAEFFRDFDALLCPVAPVTAIPHDHSPVEGRTLTVDGATRPYGDLGSWISLAGVAYLPATVAPVGRAATGLPVGIEIVGPYLEDRTTIDLARRLSELIGGFEPPPGFS